MNIEDHVTSLKLSKKLKELGVKQESEFYWAITLTTNYHLSWYGGKLPMALKDRNDVYSAFLASELGERLPLQKDTDWMIVGRNPLKDEWCIDYKKEWHRADTLPDALAKMLIYLIENRLVDSKEKA